MERSLRLNAVEARDIVQAADSSLKTPLRAALLKAAKLA
jgi:hypothetical protein